MNTGGRARLDVELVCRELVRSRAQARAVIAAGRVRVDGRTRSKPSTPIAPDSVIEVIDAGQQVWVGRAAYKLAAAIEQFGPEGLDVRERTCLDVGASTGGFTQVLLHHGARHVVALDVGHDQLAATVSADPRVTERSGVNIRDVGPTDLGGPFDVVVVDVSFISLCLIVGPLREQLATGGDLVVLVKPQFEVGRARLGKGGIVRARRDRLDALRSVLDAAGVAGFDVLDLMPSPIRGAAGNLEYLVWLTTSPAVRPGAADLERLIDQMEPPL
ncbi:MAG: 16S/23S rRNA (cytidine-2'-O)-methyltransferase [Actinomycetales bacterium]|nr:MAG: 16S/23S rRNA (cytidine-2'-O)-methyltransferase [Actinomycetales bacterium]